MNKIDKIIRLVLGWIGGLFDICTFIIKYILGLIWSLYRFIRGHKFKSFSYLNKNAISELEWIADEFKHYLQD